MAAFLGGLFSASILATIGIATAFVILRLSPFRGGLPAPSLAALYVLLLLGLWTIVAIFRPSRPFIGETYWFPLAGLSVLAALLWLYRVLKGRRTNMAGTVAFRPTLPMSPLAYMASAAALIAILILALLAR